MELVNNVEDLKLAYSGADNIVHVVKKALALCITDTEINLIRRLTIGKDGVIKTIDKTFGKRMKELK